MQKMEALLALLLLAALTWYWLDGARAREIGIAAARQACQAEELQFLDDTVAQNGLRWVRNQQGRLILQRSFAFEYSCNGNDRHPGLVALQGHQVVLLQTGNHAQMETRTLH